MITLTKAEQEMLIDVAADVGTNPTYLTELIIFESGFDPLIKNAAPKSTARGLIQFTDETARELGYTDSLDLVTKHPSIEDQLDKPVRAYLKQYSPYPTKQSLYMGVFYPAAQYWPVDKEFPAWVAEKNFGIDTPAAYIEYVNKNVESVVVMNEDGQIIKDKARFNFTIPIIAVVLIGIYFLTKETS